jgi:D-alanyl-D-alanine dipeptidase
LCIVSCKSQTIVSDAKNNSSIINDTTFVNLKDYSLDFVYDMKYATTDNFLKAKVYDCEACFLRLKTVTALVEVNKKFMKKDLKSKFLIVIVP